MKYVVSVPSNLFKKTFYPLLENYLGDVEFANSSLSTTSMSKGCGKDSAEDTYMKTMRAVIKFAVPWDFVDSDQIDFYKKNYGIQFIQSSARYSDQNKVINDALSLIRDSCGPYCLVSVNDMDHYLVWQNSGSGPTELESASKKFYRYSSYPDAAMLYMYSFLSAPGCGNKVCYYEVCILCVNN